MNDTLEQLSGAIKDGRLEEVERLLAADPERVNCRLGGNVSPLLWSIYYRQEAVTDFLLTRPELELTIFDAAAAGQEEALRGLLQVEPDLANAFAPDGFQPLGLAAFFGHFRAAALLLESGANPLTPARNTQWVTPLHSAAAGQHLQLARLLLAHGADPHARQGGGFTPLHSAAQNGQWPLVELLLDQGADPQAAADDGRTPLDLALSAGHEELRELLE